MEPESQKKEKWMEALGKQYTDEDLEEHYTFAEKDQRFHAFWRPIIGGLTFGIGGALLVLSAVFGWTYYLLGQGTTIFVWGMLVGAIVLLIGVSWTS